MIVPVSISVGGDYCDGRRTCDHISLGPVGLFEEAQRCNEPGVYEIAIRDTDFPDEVYPCCLCTQHAAHILGPVLSPRAHNFLATDVTHEVINLVQWIEFVAAGQADNRHGQLAYWKRHTRFMSEMIYVTVKGLDVPIKAIP
jgi:hypothetical protein